MSRRLVLGILAVGVLVTVALAAAAAGISSGGHHHQPQLGESRPISKPHTPKEVRRMIDELDHRRIEASIRTLAGFGTRNTLSSQTDPVRGIGAARDWLFEQFSDYAEDSDGRLTVELQSYTQTSRPSGPDRHHERGRDAEGNGSGLDRPHVRDQRPLRLALREHEQRDVRRARCERRRVRRRRGARARARDVQAGVRVHDRLHGGRGRGAGPLRFGALRHARAVGRPRHPGDVHERHRRKLPGRKRRPRTARRPRLRRGRPDERDGARRRTPAARSAARTTRRPARWRAS